MGDPVSYRRDESIAIIILDAGKVNALGPPMQQAINTALDRADRDDAAAVVIAGNERVFSGGFDLKVLACGQVQPASDMLRGGFELAYRLLAYPKPVVMACTGHAIAMGATRELADLNQPAHLASKLRARADGLAALRAGIDGIEAEFGQ
jgi:enoyl-CoA hydratase